MVHRDPLSASHVPHILSGLSELRETSCCCCWTTLNTTGHRNDTICEGSTTAEQRTLSICRTITRHHCRYLDMNSTSEPQERSHLRESVDHSEGSGISSRHRLSLITTRSAVFAATRSIYSRSGPGSPAPDIRRRALSLLSTSDLEISGGPKDKVGARVIYECKKAAERVERNQHLFSDKVESPSVITVGEEELVEAVQQYDKLRVEDESSMVDDIEEDTILEPFKFKFYKMEDVELL
ncbi:hypothetical protein ABVT39_004478 [Epinephelus coioides]